MAAQSRRDFLKALGIAAGSFVMPQVLFARKQSPRKPNVLLIFTDDKGRKLPSAKDFLSNMTKDTTETKNIADQHPDIVERLTKLHNNWVKEVQNQ